MTAFDAHTLNTTQKALNNSINHIAAPSLDEQLEKAAWAKETVTA